jgi:hypothetical protein
MMALLALAACQPKVESSSSRSAVARTEVAFLAAPAPVCVNPVKPNCDFYTRCMEATCKCGYGSSGYALSYGKKYCERFQAETNFTASGQKWRDATLRCLQERQVAKLPATSQGCNCPQLRNDAYSAHVECYTLPGSSICDLPGADIYAILKTVDNSDLTDRNGVEASVAVGRKCLSANPASQTWKQFVEVGQAWLRDHPNP